LTKSSKPQITRRTLLPTSVEAFGETTFCKERKGKFGDEAWGHVEKTSGKLA
jgi:hypothetical protein